ncbi:hypothetical protein SynPROS91_01147 [Synechococcus sp. PROS-9-1]|uniref:hypothetical protein n=1 Tax=Synechococcus sp. PROS-9-1 TaxID=1968775 RepID=UPI001862D073|nr:hypothetical protein [Synechococcus sp. PROS-9-1]QNJ31525.1 hypothetical protein SynPROS91_01147 [Synechococcus sp. PROS-9-1]
MFEKGKAIKKQRQLEASAWMEVHRKQIGIPTEIEGVSVIGQLHHPILSDGWDSLPWRASGSMIRSKQNSKGLWSNGGKDHAKSERSIHTFKNRKAMDACLKARKLRAEKAVVVGKRRQKDGGLLATIQPGSIRLQTVPDSFKQVAKRSGYILGFTPEEWRVGQSARRQALGEVSRGGLKAKTVVLGMPVPKNLLINKEELWSERQSYRGRICHLADLFTEDQLDGMNPEEMVPDTKRVELVAYSELLAYLIAGGLTPKETEALELNAAGMGQLGRSGRENLHRARRRARAIMAGPITIKSWDLKPVDWLHAEGIWTTV